MQVLMGLGVALGLLVGIPTGMALQQARAAVKAHSTAKEAMPGLKKTAWSARTRTLRWLLVSALFVALILIALAQNPPE